MEISRRGFLKLSGASAVVLATGLGLDVAAAESRGFALKIEGSTKITSICHFCSCGCSLLLHIKDGKLIHLEGDPDSAVNEGTLCSKASSLEQVAYADHRPKTPLYRAPGATEWQEITWHDAIHRIAKKMKEIRDRTFVVSEEVTQADGTKKTVTVNRTEGIGILGSAEIDNEECYLLKKFSVQLGIPYHEHQARI